MFMSVRWIVLYASLRLWSDFDGFWYAIPKKSSTESRLLHALECDSYKRQSTGAFESCKTHLSFFFFTINLARAPPPVGSVMRCTRQKFTFRLKIRKSINRVFIRTRNRNTIKVRDIFSGFFFLRYLPKFRRNPIVIFSKRAVSVKLHPFIITMIVRRNPVEIIENL